MTLHSKASVSQTRPAVFATRVPSSANVHAAMVDPVPPPKITRTYSSDCVCPSTWAYDVLSVPFMLICFCATGSLLACLCFHQIGDRRSLERKPIADFSHYTFLQRYVTCTAGFLAQTNLSTWPQERMSRPFTGACRVPRNSVATSPEFKRVARPRISPALVARRIYDVIGGKQIDAVFKCNSITS